MPSIPSDKSWSTGIAPKAIKVITVGSPAFPQVRPPATPRMHHTATQIKDRPLRAIDHRRFVDQVLVGDRRGLPLTRLGPFIGTDLDALVLNILGNIHQHRPRPPDTRQRKGLGNHFQHSSRAEPTRKLCLVIGMLSP